MKRNGILLTLLLLTASLVSVAGPAERERCRYGVMLAQKAYLDGTYDAQQPLKAWQYRYLVDYWRDMMIVPSDRSVALRAVNRYVKVIKQMGVRRPNRAYMFEATNSILYTECSQL